MTQPWIKEVGSNMSGEATETRLHFEGVLDKAGRRFFEVCVGILSLQIFKQLDLRSYEACTMMLSVMKHDLRYKRKEEGDFPNENSVRDLGQISLIYM